MDPANLFEPGEPMPEEVTTVLYESATTRIEQIISWGQATAESFWYDQAEDEWLILLMLCYAAGHSVLVLIAGTSVGFVQRLKGSAHYERFSFWSEKILGALIFAVGVYMFWLAL